MARTMIVGIGIRTGAKSSESPGIDDANEGAVVGTLKVKWQDPLGELLGLKDLPGSAVRHPSHDAGKGRVRQHVLELGGELGLADFANGLSGTADTDTAVGETAHYHLTDADILGKVTEIAIDVPRAIAVLASRFGRTAQAGAVVSLLPPLDILSGLDGTAVLTSGGRSCRCRGGDEAGVTPVGLGRGPGLPLVVLSLRVHAVGFHPPLVMAMTPLAPFLRLGDGELLLLPQIHLLLLPHLLLLLLPDLMLGRSHGRHGRRYAAAGSDSVGHHGISVGIIGIVRCVVVVVADGGSLGGRTHDELTVNCID